MAQKFGGQYSPNGQSSDDSQSQNVLRLVNPPLIKAKRRLTTYRVLAGVVAVGGLFSLVAGNPFAALAGIATFFGVLLATEITKAGLEAEAAYHARTISRAPAWPRKAIGAAIMGATFALSSKFFVGADWLTSIGVGLAGGLGMILSFGLDPMRSKGIAGENRYEATRTAEAIDRAQKYLDELRALSKNLPNRRSQLEIESLALSAEDMFRALEGDPQDFRASRRYLGVYLQGARNATEQYLALPKTQQTAEAEAHYLSLIRELDAGFRQQREAILNDNRNALNIEIDVLREKLKSEGVVLSKEEDTL